MFVVLAAFSGESAAATRYRFRESANGRPALEGIVHVDGGAARIDIERGDGLVLHDGERIYTTHGSPVIRIADPSRRRYSEISLAELLAGLGKLAGAGNAAFNVQILNPQTTARDLGEGAVLAGHHTRRYAVESSCDVVITAGGGAAKLHVTSRSQRWTTTELSRDLSTVLDAGAVKSGIAALDDLLTKQRDAVPGFPLKEVVSTTFDLEGEVTRTTTIMIVERIESYTPRAGEFDLPADYRRVDRRLTRH